MRRAILVGALAIVLGPPGAAVAQAAAADSASLFPASYPQYSLRRELILGAVGAGFAIGTALVSPDIRPVPTTGLAATRVDWSFDREVVGTFSARADHLSDRTRDVATVYPFLLAWTSNPGARWSALGRRSLVYAEAYGIAGGLTYFSKRLISRPRPYTYLTAAERGTSSAYDVSQGSAFESMPSGHATSSFVGAGLAITEHLLSRPQASGLERFGVAALGGVLGGATATLRVEAGKHFPSDVLAGAGIGLMSGVSLPLIHRGQRPLPTRRAWLQAAGGLLTGALLSAAVMDAVY